jgi:uncharacterized membrane protein
VDRSQHLTSPALQRAVDTLESAMQLDRPAALITQVARRVGEGRRGAVLRGEWLGHALHPLLTDFPLGCWLGAGLLDVCGGRRSRPASRRLVGLGLVFTLPTVAAGLADYAEIENPRPRRVGALHAIGNGAVALSYVMSWNARRRGRHWRGVGWGLVGGTGAWVTGYLGGHLSLARRIGTGPRGIDLAPESVALAATDGETEQDALIASGARPVLVNGDLGLEGPNPA